MTKQQQENGDCQCKFKQHNVQCTIVPVEDKVFFKMEFQKNKAFF